MNIRFKIVEILYRKLASVSHYSSKHFREHLSYNDYTKIAFFLNFVSINFFDLSA
jgi:hypothetical protein